MRTKGIFKVLAASVLAINVLVSCTDDDQTPKSSSGQLGKISIDRTDIGAYQPFTLECPVVLGENLRDEKIYWEKSEFTLPVDKTEMKDGKLYYYVRGLKAGNHTLACKMHAYGMDGQEYSSVQEIQVNVKATDIRNNYWGESKEETRRNLQYYSSFDASEDGVFYISESDSYNREQDFSSEITELGQILGTRTVRYNFNNAGKLNMITYACVPNQYAKDIIGGIVRRQDFLNKYYNFNEPVYGYQVATGKTLTEEETRLAEEFKAGGLSQDDVDGTLQKAVADKKLILYIDMVGEKSLLRLSIELSVGGNVLIYQNFTPKSGQ